MTKPTSPEPKHTASRWFFAAAMAVMLGIVFWVTHRPANPEAQAGHGAKRPVPVVLTQVVTQTVPVEIKTIGNVESVSSVILKSQTDGLITSIRFKEGDQVRQGELLFTIDTRPIEAAIDQAQATVNKDQAQVAQARAQLAKDQAQVRQAVATVKRDQAQRDFARAQEKRYASLLSQQFISQSEYEQTLASNRSAEQTVLADRASLQNAKAILDADLASIHSAEATVQADQANVESNRIKLAYCYIHAPFTGRTGSLKVHMGDTVQTNNTPMVVLSQLNPINVGFSIPEQSMEAVRAANHAKPFTVSVITRETPPTQLLGKLKFMENTVDVTTGTLRLKATFQNDNHLWPGQFVDVNLELAQEPNALVIPSQAIQSGQKGDYVYVNQNGKATMRAIIVDRVVNDLAVIRSGLRLGDSVVTDGQFQLTPGAPIRAAGPRNSEQSNRHPPSGQNPSAAHPNGGR
jgi:multidrug efflux system membrane fusion protein